MTLSLPLLSKELFERAARKRTYQLRVLFAVLLYLAFFTAFSEIFMGANRYHMAYYVGRGREMLQVLTIFLMAGVLLFVPATTADTLTGEKERDSLCLLFLTKLSPWQILLQKFFGGMVSILSLMFAALPLLAISYAYGGVTLNLLLVSTLTLLMCCAQVVGIAVMSSAFCRSTVGAFMLTYAITLALYLLPLIPCVIFDIAPFKVSGADSDLLPWVASVCPVWLVAAVENRAPTSVLLVRSVPSILSLIVILTLGRFWLVRRATLPGGNPLLRIFGYLETLRISRLFGAVRPTADRIKSLPTSAPIAWREMKQKALARPLYLFWLLLLVEVPVIAYSLLLTRGPWYQAKDLKIMGMLVLWGLGALIVCINATNAIVSERIQQTLDVLLTTPLTAREIVRQKAQVMRRFLWVVAAPILTFSVLGRIFLNIHDSPSHYHSRENPLLYFGTLGLGLAILLPLISWLSLWIGMICRTRFRAIVTALGAMVLWSALPIVCGVLMVEVFHFRSRDVSWIFCASPACIPALNEVGGLREISRHQQWLAVLLNFTVYGALLAWVRHHCLSRADSYLRR